MNRLCIVVTVFVLVAFFVCPESRAALTRISVTKGSRLEKELGFSINVTENGENNGMAGTVTVEMIAPRTSKLQDLSRVILRMRQDKETNGRFPLEVQQGKSGENSCHFQLTPGLAKGAVLELICPVPNMPNGVIYEIDLSEYVTGAD